MSRAQRNPKRVAVERSARRRTASWTVAGVVLAAGLLLVAPAASPAEAQTVVRSVAADGAVPTGADNDFLRLDRAIGTASPGEVILLEGIFDWTEPNAGASWARGSDGVAGTADDYRLSVPGGLDGVTLAATVSGVAAVTGPGDLPVRDGDGFLFFPGPNHDWTISGLVVLDFDAAVAFSTGAGATFDRTLVQGNFVRVATDLDGDFAPSDSWVNYGLRLASGPGQTVVDNVFEMPGTGGSDTGGLAKSIGVELQGGGGAAAYDGLLVEGNTFQVSGLPRGRLDGGELISGFEDVSAAHASDIVVRDNRFVNLDPANEPVGNREVAFRVRAHSGPGTTVLYQGNRVEGAETGVLWTLGGDLSPLQPIRFVANTFVDGHRAFVVGSGGSAELRCNRIVEHVRAIDILRNEGSVSAERNWWGCNGGPGAPGCVPLTLDGTGPIPVSPWLVLSVEEAVVGAGESAPLRAGFTRDSGAQPVLECSVPDGIPVAFAVAEGTVSPAEAGTVDGTATVLYTADKGGRRRTVDVTAQADGETVAGEIEVVPPGQSGK